MKCAIKRPQHALCRNTIENPKSLERCSYSSKQQINQADHKSENYVLRRSRGADSDLSCWVNPQFSSNLPRLSLLELVQECEIVPSSEYPISLLYENPVEVVLSSPPSARSRNYAARHEMKEKSLQATKVWDRQASNLQQLFEKNLATPG